MRIWKWPLEVTDKQTIEMPIGAKILTVQVQNETPCLWALCNEKVASKRKRIINIYGTGNPLVHEHPGQYIATFQLHGGALVFHVFEEQ